jgi:nucleotidyltransferase substrate binding protein (TIGR01987 family)
MDQDIRWKQRFENFAKALKKLQSFAEHEQAAHDELSQVALTGAFEFTFELGWKTVKDHLKFNGVDVSLPREAIKQGFHHRLIEDGETWIAMLEDRNLLSHVYDEKRALAAVQNIHARYIPALVQVHDLLKSKL